MIELSPDDWVEIYNIVEMRTKDLIDRGELKAWIGQLQDIMDRIGPDGEIASVEGVYSNGTG